MPTGTLPTPLRRVLAGLTVLTALVALLLGGTPRAALALTPTPSRTVGPTDTPTATSTPTPAAPAGIAFDDRDRSLCRYDAGSLSVSGTVSLPAGQQALLVTNWYVVNPADQRTSPAQTEHGLVSDGDRFSVAARWPGIRPGDTIVQLYTGAILLDPQTRNPLMPRGASRSYYWYPWVCAAPTAQPATATPTPTNTPTPTVHVNERFRASVVPSAYQLTVGQVLNVTGTIYNESVGVSFGLPQYRLRIENPDGSEQSQTSPIFTPARPDPVVHYLGIAPGQSDSTVFVLQAARPGTIQLSLSVSGEVCIIGPPGCAGGHWGAASARSLSITVVQAATPTFTPTPTPTATPGLIGSRKTPTPRITP